MDYKTQSILTVAVLAAFMVSVGIFINNLEGSITGAAVSSVCECSSDTDCYDDDPCTEDVCLYPDTCEASICVHRKIEGCTASKN